MEGSVLSPQNPKKKTCPCPDVNLEDWRDNTLVFRLKPFLVRTIPRFLWIPIALREEIVAIYARAAALRLKLAAPAMVLEQEGGLFRGRILLAINEEAGFPDRLLLTGLYRTAVHRGSAVRLGVTRRRLVTRLKRELGVTPGEIYYWYVNCPKCWHTSGGQAVVILARVGSPPAEETSR